MSPLSNLPRELPLRGVQLIEASAGTGKTFTIALLYVRLVLGHGQPGGDTPGHEHGHARTLVPPEILVVTFTEAASLELRDRIRRRLVEATEAFRAVDDGDGLDQRDPLLAALRDDFSPTLWPLCARRLELAAEWMDDAAISTIHSWAQRMLREHAFDSGRLFSQEIVKDLTEPTLEAVADYWRTRVYPLEESLAAVMVSLFESPQKLYQALRTLLQREDADLVYAGEALAAEGFHQPLARLGECLAAARRAEVQARNAWQREAGQVLACLHELRPGMNGNRFRGKNDDGAFAAWLEELHSWGGGELPLKNAGFVGKLAGLQGKLNKGYQVPVLALFDELDAWDAAQAEAEQLREALYPLVLADARQWVSRRLAEQLEAQARMSFDEMIRGLADALDGPAGTALARRIRRQFPVAMIDEFQDTDPAQYRIFAAVYGVGAPVRSEPLSAPAAHPGEEDTALILIGDPKQAIYGFRGGDIHTYLSARRATEGSHHHLDTNFRSSQAAVDAVNQLFRHAEESHREGAFRFARPEQPEGNPLPFHPVAAKGRREQWWVDGQPAAALTGWLLAGDDDSGLLTKAAYLREAARHCANRIAEWLNLADRGRCGFAAPGREQQELLRARDIAILVRDRGEARAIREALAERGLASVYLSDRDSVFATAEARDLLHWLRAMASPESVSTLRTALATATLGLPLTRLDQLQRDEAAWEHSQETFIAYRRHWQQRGVLPALRQLLHDYQVPERLLASPGGERRLTNILHLAEWAQHASDSLDGDHALVRLLAEHIEEPGQDEQILRLESDADLIQVVTIFKSKGLEYPVVALPFVCSFREVNAKYGPPLFYRDDRPLLELAPKKELARESFEAADDERLSEEVRLLYVALTRARHATFLGLAPLKIGNAKTAQLHKSALGYLLAGREEIPDLPSLRAHWQTLGRSCSAIALDERDSEHTVYPGAAGSSALQAARTPGHRPFERWWIASYSALQQHGSGAPETFEAEVRGEEHLASPGLDTPGVGQGSPRPGSLHAFPRGPEPGTFLHGVLESLASAGFHRALEDRELLQQMEQRCRRRNWQLHTAALQQGLRDWLTTPLAAEGEHGPVLAQLQHYRAEPDFWFATSRANATELDRLVRLAVFPGQPRPPLRPQQLNGLMKGFIDLLLEHEGRYYVVDWKSNWLGPDDSAYHPLAMQHALLDKRYDLQLAIYLVALHRHLRHTLGDGYDYERDVGGAMLVFLRGIRASSRGVVRIKPPRALVETWDACLAGETAEEISA